MSRHTKIRSYELTWYGPEIAKVVERAQEPGLWAMGKTLIAAAQRRAPRASGRLQDSGFVATARRTDYKRGRGDRRRKEMVRLLSSVGKDQALIGFAAWYSNLLEDTGAKVHAIPYVAKTGKARKRKVLLIPGIGYRRRVMHPGMKRQRFLSPAVDAARGAAADDFAQAIERELEKDLK
jgi:hypothetical protein